MSDADTPENPPTTPPPGSDVSPITIEEEMRSSYLDYAMSVIVSRALPDVRDGLKPVHRRILFTMKQGGYDSTKPYRKSARIVGDVMGQYHPHGDSAIYDALVRMAQDFSMSLPLVDGQGNFGSMDGDPAAAMRYTEARMQKVTEFLLDDIDKETVDFIPNYDDSQMEPTVLPSRIPNALVNGAGGIAVGMATNIPPHNLGEVISACLAYIDDPTITTEQLIADHIPGPDFPTGGEILGKSGSYKAYTTGNGSVMMRAKSEFEEFGKDGIAIIFTEIPYQQNKAKLVERMAQVARDKLVEGIRTLRDESSREGLRIVVELKRDAQPEVVLAQLYRHTPLQTSFGANMLALDGGRPRIMTLRDFISLFVKFREEVITRRTVYLLGKARDRAHVLVGLAVAVANIDEMIAVIRNAPDPNSAREELMSRKWPVADVEPMIRLIDEPINRLSDTGTYTLSETQARAILDLRLHRLTGLERDKIGGELKDVTDQIAEYLLILADREKLMGVMRNELEEISEKFAVPRRTTLVDAEFEADMEALITREDMVVTVSNQGYVKRVALDTYRAQKRGGKGRSGMQTKDEDFVSTLFAASTHTPCIFFTTRGLAHALKVYKLPAGSPQAKGRPLINLIPVEQGESLSAVLTLPENEEEWAELDVVFATASGYVRRNKMSDFANIRSNGLIAVKLDEGDSLVSVKLCRPEDTVLLTTAAGKAIRFPVEEVRVFAGRNSRGVRGIKLAEKDTVIGMSILRDTSATIEDRDTFLKLSTARRRGDEGVEQAIDEFGRDKFEEMQEVEQFVLTVSDNGYGKRSSSFDYRQTKRGGQGFFAMSMGGKVNGLAAAFAVDPGDQIMLVTDGGQMIRTGVEDIRIAARATQGVTLFRVADGETIVSVARLSESLFGEDEEEELEAAEAADGEAAEASDATPDAEQDGDSTDEEPGDE
ncbi:MAG: DNA gyrase subunit A [Alphaproteobacteria bacterium]